MNDRDADRKVRIADAAIDVLGRDGLRALTHRAVDARAGLPQGTCSYHHRTRRSLLGAALARIAGTRPRRHGAARRPATPSTGRWRCWAAGSAPAATRSRARLVLMLDVEARRDLGEEAGRLAGEFVAGATAAVGDPERARLMVALLDGLVADDLVRGGDGPPPEPVLRARVAAVFAAGWPSPHRSWTPVVASRPIAMAVARLRVGAGEAYRVGVRGVTVGDRSRHRPEQLDQPFPCRSASTVHGCAASRSVCSSRRACRSRPAEVSSPAESSQPSDPSRDPAAAHSSSVQPRVACRSPRPVPSRRRAPAQRLAPGDPGGEQRRHVPVAAVFAQHGGGVPEAREVAVRHR